VEIFNILVYNFAMKKFILILFGLFFIGVSSVSAALPWQKVETGAVEVDETTQQAKILYAQNEIDEALKLLKGKAESERSAEDWLLIGNILQDKDKISEAVYMFKKSIKTDEKFYKAHYNLGYIYLIQEKPNMALEEFKKAVKYKDDFAYGYYNMGCAYLKLKQYGSAKYNFFRAVDIKNDEPMFYYNLAYAYKQMGKEKQANTYLDIYNKLQEKQQ
jgi:tetratricopeptide (TPR) repeat protein